MADKASGDREYPIALPPGAGATETSEIPTAVFSSEVAIQ
jgi:hypothetical protein